MKAKTNKPKAKKSFRRGKFAKAKMPEVQKKAIVKLVKREIGVEIKRAVYNTTLYATTLQSTSTTLAGNYLICTPSENATYGYNVVQGTQNNQRAGNRITISRLVFDFVMNPQYYNATTNPAPKPTLIRFWFFSSKLNPSAIDDIASYISGSGSSQFLENGNSATGLAGNWYDYTRKVNPDSFIYHKHYDYKLGYSSATGTGNQPGAEYYNNNDFKLVIKDSIDLTKYANKIVKWDDANQVNSTWLKCIIQVIGADGLAYTPAQVPIMIMGSLNLFYTDV